MVEIILPILLFIVSVLAVLQGWQMTQNRRERRNPNSIAHKLDIIISKLELLSRRMDDIWEKLK